MAFALFHDTSGTALPFFAQLSFNCCNQLEQADCHIRDVVSEKHLINGNTNVSCTFGSVVYLDIKIYLLSKMRSFAYLAFGVHYRNATSRLENDLSVPLKMNICFADFLVQCTGDRKGSSYFVTVLKLLM